MAIHSRFETADYGLLHEAALAGMGLFVTFETTIAKELADGRLRTVLLTSVGNRWAFI